VQTGQGILDAALGTQGKAIVQPHQESQLSRRDLLLEVARHKPSQRRRDKTYQQTATLFSAHDVPRVRSYGLAHMSKQEKMQAELSILNLDVSSHVMDFHSAFLKNLRATRSSHLLACRSNQDVVVAGIKVAIQTPPVRSGRRVVFLTLDDGAGPIDVTFFEDVQQDYAATLFSSWLLLVRGHVRRTGARGLSIRATGCWDLLAIEKIWSAEGATAARNAMTPPVIRGEASMQEQAESRSVRPVLVHPSGFRQSPYADVRPAGTHPSSHRHSDGNTG
jgi:error-prone DNA polymerase